MIQSDNAQKNPDHHLQLPKIQKSKNKKNKSDNPFSLPHDGQLLAYGQYKKKHPDPPDTWKLSDIKSSIAQLQVEKTDSNISLIKTLRDKAKNYPFAKSAYVRDVRTIFKYQLYTGIRRDAILQINQNIDRQKRKFIQTKKQCLLYENQLEDFLAKDHGSSMEYLSRAEAEAAKTRQLTEQRDELSRQLGRLRIDIYRADDEWKTVKMCYDFLVKASPLKRLEARPGPPDDRALNLNKDPVAEASTFELAERTSMESLISKFERDANYYGDLKQQEPEELGLSNAEDLVKLFQGIEEQNLNALVHLGSLNAPIAEMIKEIKRAEERMQSEMEDIEDSIRRVEESIKNEELLAKKLKDRSVRLIQGVFRQLVCSEEVLRLRLMVEDAYVSCINSNFAGLDTLAMTRALEQAYERLNQSLDKLPRNIVVQCEREGFKQEIRETREAEQASRKYESMCRLLKALKRLMEPPPPRKRMLVFRSAPIPPARPKTDKGKKEKDEDSSDQVYFAKSCKPSGDRQGSTKD